MASNANTSVTTETAKPAVETTAPAAATPVAALVKAETPAPEVAKIVPAPVKAAKPAPVLVAKPAVAKVTKPAPVKAVKRSPVKVAKPAQALVTKIVSAKPTPIIQGVTKMTDTVKATAAKANDYFADVREKATEAADKSKKMAADAVEFNKANVEAMIEAGKIAAKGVQDMGKTNVEFAKQNFAEMQVAVKEITSVKSPTDFMKLQSEYARKSFDVAVAQASKNTEAMVKLVSDMFQPISNRIAVTTDLFKKAA